MNTSAIASSQTPMTVEQLFRTRAREVLDYLKSLQSLERMHHTPGRGFYRATSAITASRASAFIMIYNCVEYGSREALVAVRQEILHKGEEYGRLKLYWREEIARAHFRDRLAQGSSHERLLKDFAGFVPGKVDWKSDFHKLPFPGNVDNDEWMRFIRRIDMSWTPPRSSLGGSDLVLVRQMRNVLAHGADTFENVGSQFSTEDMIDKFRRIRAFMVSLIKALEKYRQSRAYNG